MITKAFLQEKMMKKLEGVCTHRSPESNTAYLYRGKEGIGRLGVSGAIPLQRLSFRNAFSTRWRSLYRQESYGPLLFSILFAGNDHIHFGIQCISDDFIGIIGSIRQLCLSRNALNQMDCFLTSCSGAFCDRDSHWHTMRIHGEMEFCVEPRATS